MDDITSKSLNSQSQSQHISFLDWSEFTQIIQALAQYIQADKSPQVIVGLQRGGLIPAVCLSHKLGVRRFLSLPVSRTTSDVACAQKTTPSVTQMPPDLLRRYITEKDVLVVDDIAGTGESVKETLDLLTSFAPTRVRSALCVVNRDNWDPHNVHQPTEVLTYVGKEVHGWVVFPWEMPQDQNSSSIR